MPNSIPPQDKASVSKISIIAHTIIDIIALISITVLVIINKLDTTTGVALIALIAGVWINNSNGKPPSINPSVVLAAITGMYKALLFYGRGT